MGSPTLVHVKPSSSDRWTWMSVLFAESWYEMNTRGPSEVIHWRSAPSGVSSGAMVNDKRPGVVAAFNDIAIDAATPAISTATAKARTYRKYMGFLLLWKQPFYSHQYFRFA